MDSADASILLVNYQLSIINYQLSIIMSHPFPTPPIQPFERLQATDGLLVNAERWRKAHDYHRRRQNAHCSTPTS